jgi:hypothetical protein
MTSTSNSVIAQQGADSLDATKNIFVEHAATAAPTMTDAAATMIRATTGSVRTISRVATSATFMAGSFSTSRSA